MNFVLIIDSGMGGLTIYDAIKNHLPNIPLAYCFDNAAFPYGEKKEEEIYLRIKFCIKQLLQRIKVSIIVIACNTASTASSLLTTLRTEFCQPIVGVVPAIKPAAEASKNRCIGILATSGTIKRSYTLQMLKTYANDCQIINIGSSELVNFAEQKMRGLSIIMSKINKILQPFLINTTIPDYIVLGCTHFILLSKELNYCTRKQNICWIDSSLAIAKRVETLLNDKAITYHNTEYPLFCTKQYSFSPWQQKILLQKGLSIPIILSNW